MTKVGAATKAIPTNSATSTTKQNSRTPLHKYFMNYTVYYQTAPNDMGDTFI